MPDSENPPGGCGCLGLILGLGFMGLLGGGQPPRSDAFPDDVPPWEIFPPPDLLDPRDEDEFFG